MEHMSPAPSERGHSSGAKRPASPTNGRKTTTQSTAYGGKPRSASPAGRSPRTNGAAPNAATGQQGASTTSTPQGRFGGPYVAWRAGLIFIRLAIIGVCCYDISGLLPLALTWGSTPDYVSGSTEFATAAALLICCLIVDSIDIVICLVSILYTWRPVWRTNGNCCTLLGPYKTDMICDGLIVAWNLGMSIVATGMLQRPYQETLGGWLLGCLPLVTIALSVKLAALHIAAETARQQLPVQQQPKQLRRVVKPRAASPKSRSYQLPDGMV